MLFARTKGVVGLDIGSATLKLVELREKRGGWYSLQRLGVEPLSLRAIVSGSLLHYRDIDPIHHGDINPRLNHQATPPNPATMLSGNAIFIKNADHPSQHHEKAVAIRWVAEQHLPLVGANPPPSRGSSARMVKRDKVSDYDTDTTANRPSLDIPRRNALAALTPSPPPAACPTQDYSGSGEYALRAVSCTRHSAPGDDNASAPPRREHTSARPNRVARTQPNSTKRVSTRKQPGPNSLSQSASATCQHALWYRFKRMTARPVTTEVAGIEFTRPAQPGRIFFAAAGDSQCLSAFKQTNPRECEETDQCNPMSINAEKKRLAFSQGLALASFSPPSSSSRPQPQEPRRVHSPHRDASRNRLVWTASTMTLGYAAPATITASLFPERELQ